MKVSTKEPYRVIYSLFKHEYLGYLFESFAIQLNEKGELTLRNQNISHKNATDFGKDLTREDYRLIELMDSIQQEPLYLKFHKKKSSTDEFFLKTFDEETGDKLLKEAILNYVEIRLAEILTLLPGKPVYIMGKNGLPNWKKVNVQSEKATVLFHFRKNEDNTHYFPTIKFQGEKIDFQYNESKIICDNPGWLLTGDKIFSFAKDIDGKKIRPFLNKKFVAIPKKIEDSYYQNFVAPLVEKYDVYAKGFRIETERIPPKPRLQLTETVSSESSYNLFDQKEVETDNIKIELQFKYGKNVYPVSQSQNGVKVMLSKEQDEYVFHRIKRNLREEKDIEIFIKGHELPLRGGKIILPKSRAYSWVSKYQKELDEREISIVQKNVSNKEYFVGKASIDLEIKENNDWFDINGIVRFGEFEIPFLQLKKYILSGKKEFTLPNGKIAVIPEEWFADYLEIFAFAFEDDGLKLKRHHAPLVNAFREGELATVTMSRKLERLKDFHDIEDQDIPEGFVGELRPYQKAGFNWLAFLDEANLGGCLADDMGLGKTVQTLILLQAQKEKEAKFPSLLVVPTSLVYNWVAEARRFCPKLKTFTFTGTNRPKNTKLFNKYDLIITTYGTLRIDVDLLKEYMFNYVILDESQKIKNPESHISKAVRELKSKRKLILTGTPIENTTMDLWSQMSFINPGLLGDQGFFKKEFQVPIEKKSDQDKSKKLYSLVKPFILRRKKEQVASDLPEKIENIQYCEMTEEQEKEYESVKSYYRNALLKQIEEKGLASTKFMILQGLTKLRQIANHPKLVDENYDKGSGKLDEVFERLETVVDEGHKVLVFSQFVKHLALVKEKLQVNGIRFSYLDGTTKDREKVVSQFQNSTNIQVFLISLKAGGVGLNLTAANYVFLLDPWWNPAVESQAIDRAHRIGQQRSVFTYKFISRNTVEEKILSLQQKKLKLVSDLISVDENIVKSLTEQDIEALLE